MNVLRHLSVPNRQVEETLSILRDSGWLAPSMRILFSEVLFALTFSFLHEKKVVNSTIAIEKNKIGFIMV